MDKWPIVRGGSEGLERTLDLAKPMKVAAFAYNCIKLGSLNAAGGVESIIVTGREAADWES